MKYLLPSNPLFISLCQAPPPLPSSDLNTDFKANPNRLIADTEFLASELGDEVDPCLRNWQLQQSCSAQEHKPHVSKMLASAVFAEYNTV